ncbi:MAG: O-antigen ligase family protein, partial [Actinomycetota bacterium]
GAMLLVGRRSIDRSIAAATTALAAGFAGAALFSTDPATGLAVTVRVVVLGLVFLGAAAVFRTAADRRRLVAGVAVGAVAASVVGLLVLAGGGDRFGTDALVGSISVSRGVTRLTRPFSHANVAAMYLAPATILLAATASAVASDHRPRRGHPHHRSQADRGRLLLGAGALLAAGALSLTLSRSGVMAVALATVGLVLARLRSGHRFGSVGVAFPVAVAAVTIGVGAVSGRWAPRLGLVESVGGSGGAAQQPPGRLAIWSQAVEAWSSRPFVGVGPGRFGVFSRSITTDGDVAVAHAHQPVLEVLATGGLLALTGLGIFLAVVGWRTRSAFRPSPAPPSIADGHATVPDWLGAAGVAAVVPVLVDNPFLFSSSGNLIALVAGAWVGAVGGRAR